jgi:hypothetical protein
MNKMEFPNKEEISLNPELFLEKSVKIFKAKVYELTGVDLLYAIKTDSGFTTSSEFNTFGVNTQDSTVYLTTESTKLAQNFGFFLSRNYDGIKLQSVFFSGDSYYFYFKDLDSMVYFTKFFLLVEEKTPLLSLLFASLNKKERERSEIKIFDKINKINK